MEKFVYELCDSSSPDAIECRDYNNGEVRDFLRSYYSSVLDMNDFKTLYIRKRAVSEEELAVLVGEASAWRIYTVRRHGFDHFYKGSSDSTDFYTDEIPEDRIVVSEGRFVGVVFRAEDCKGDLEKLCKGACNIALLTDEAVTVFNPVFPGKEREDSYLFLAYTGWAEGTSYVNDYSYRTYYLGKK